MSQPWKTVRIFISSTFRDMHSERDHLLRVVFPELRERCARRGLHLVEVDLRWGVTEEEAERGKVLEICLDEIERCRPFFVGLLGERYGWTPPRYDVPDEPRYDWLRSMEAGHSVTALEIYHGVLRNPLMTPRAFFYFRGGAFLDAVPPELREVFLAENGGAAARLRRLKDEIRTCCRVHEDYPCEYGGTDESGRPVLAGLEVFGQRVLEDLWGAIQEEHPAVEQVSDDLDAERAYHDRFIESRARQFVGRRDLLERLSEYAAAGGAVPLAVTGSPGAGKSALLAMFAREHAAAHPETFVLPHFIGASPGSADIRRTLRRLSRELIRRFGMVEEAPEDFAGLARVFPAILEQAGAQRRVVLVVDALDQLDDSHRARSLGWIPSPLPPGVRLVVSALDGECLETLRRRATRPVELPVGPLEEADCQEIVRSTLAQYRKRLDERAGNDQLGMLLGKAEARNPLFLAVACEELRVFGEFERVSARIAALADSVPGLFEQVLERLERDHGRDLVEGALSLVACSRGGLLETEILALARREGEERLPPAVWSRLYRALAPYLRPPGEAGESALDFFHGQAREAVRRRYLALPGAAARAHARLAAFFRSQADPGGDASWAGNYPRGLGELAWHLLEAGLAGELFALARDERFLAAQRAAFPADPYLPFETIQHAISGAGRAGAAPVLASFLLDHARRIAAARAESPLDAARAGRWERAWELVDIQDPKPRAIWYLLLAWELTDSGRDHEARAALERLAAWSQGQGSVEATVAGAAILPYLARVAGELLAPLAETVTGSLDHRATACETLIRNADFETAARLAEGLARDEDRTNVHARISAEQARRGDCEAALRTARASGALAAVVNVARSYAEAGDFPAALAAARSLEPEYYRDAALRYIVRSQALAGRVEEALATAQGIGAVEERAAGIASIAAVRAEAGEIGDARRIEALVESPHQRARPAGAIAVALARAGGFEEAFTQASAIRVSPVDAETYAGIVSEQARAGWYMDAVAHAGRHLDRERRVDAMIRIAEAAETRGDRREAAVIRDAALAQARTVPSAFGKETVACLTAVALAQLRAGDRTGARTTLGEAFERLQAMGQEYRTDRASLSRQLVAAAAEAGETAMFGPLLRFAVGAAEWATFYNKFAVDTLADALLETPAGPTRVSLLAAARAVGAEHDVFLVRLALAQARTGETGEARSAIASLYTPRETKEERPWRDAALAIVVEGQARAGLFEEAYRTAARPESEPTREGALERIARQQARLKRVSDALATARRIRDEHFRGSAVRDVAREQLDAGDLEGAVKTITSRDAAAQPNEDILTGVAEAYGRAGDARRARKAIFRIRNEPQEDRAFATLVRALAEGGWLDQARSGIEWIRSIEIRAEALAWVAAAEHRSGRAAEAARTFEAALELVRWKIGSASNDPSGIDGIAMAYARAGMFREALDLERRCPGYTDHLRTRIAEEQARAGLYDDAWGTAMRVLNNNGRLEALGSVVRIQAENGDLDGARHRFRTAVDMAPRLSSHLLLGNALSLFGVVQARAGLRAEAAVLEEHLLTTRLETRLTIAKAIAEAGDTAEFGRLYGPAAHNLEAAYYMCGLLAYLYPAQASGVADVIAGSALPQPPPVQAASWWGRLLSRSRN